MSKVTRKKGIVKKLLVLPPKVLCSLKAQVHVSLRPLFLSAQGVLPPSPAHTAPTFLLTQLFVD